MVPYLGRCEEAASTPPTSVWNFFIFYLLTWGDEEGGINTTEVLITLFLGVFHDVRRILLVVEFFLRGEVAQHQDARRLFRV